MKQIRFLGIWIGICCALIAPGYGEGPSIDMAAEYTLSLGRWELPLQASGGSGTGYVWSVVTGSLPSGLAVRTDVPGWFPAGTTAGVIGVATTTSTTTATIQVKDSLNATTTKTISFTVVALNSASNWELPDASVGVTYSFTLGVVGATSSVTRSLVSGNSLPPGLSLNSTSGEIYGTPSTAGTYDFNIQFTQGAYSLQRTFRIFVSNLNISTGVILPTATVGAGYSQSITVSGGTAPYTFSSTCCLPQTLSLSSGGVISGTPGWQDFSSLNLSVADSAGATARKKFGLTVTGTPSQLPGINHPPLLSDAELGSYYSGSMGGFPGKPSSTWEVASGSALPAGFSVLDPSQDPSHTNPGQFNFGGTSLQVGTAGFTVQCTDGSTPPAVTRRSYSLRVSEMAVDSLPGAMFNVAYSRQIRVLGGTAPYAFTIFKGTYPSGMTMSSSGLLSGTPQETGWFDPWVQITDFNGKIWLRSLGVYVSAGATNIYIRAGSPLPDAFVNQSYSFPFTASGGSASYNWTIPSGSLPACLSLLSGGSLPSGSPAGSAVLTGTCTSPAQYSFLLRATDSSNSANFAQQLFRLQVTPIYYTGPGLLPYGNVSTALSRSLSVGGATGTVNYILHPDDLLPPGIALSGSGILSGTPSSSGRFWFRVVATDSLGSSATFWVSIDIYPAGGYPPLLINTSSSQVYQLGRVQQALSAEGGSGGYIWSIDPGGGSLPPGLKIRTDIPSGWASGTTAGIIGVATTIGTSLATIRVTDSVGNTTTQAFYFNVLAVNSTSNWQLPDGSLGVAYSYILGVTGNTGSVTRALPSGNSLPPGLSLNSATGEISGTPTTAGTYNFNVQFTQGSFSFQRGFQITVSKLHISTAAELPTGTVHAAYNQTVSVSGGTPPYTFSTGCCWPGGLSFSSSGVISGTPNGQTFNNFPIYVTDSSGATARKQFAMTITGSPAQLPGINYPSFFQDAELGSYYAAAAAGFPGKPPSTWSLASGSSLPAGFAVLTPSQYTWNTSPGQFNFAGTGTQVGNYSITMQWTDSSAPAASTSRTFALRVSPLAVDGLPNATLETSYSRQIRVLGGDAPYTFTLKQGAFPNGLTMSSSGLLSGTPLETGGFSPLVLVTDSSGNSWQRSMYLFVSNGTDGININNGSPLSNALVSQSYSNTLTAGGGSGAFTWTLISGSLPPGMNLLSGATLPAGAPAGSAVLSGTCPTAGQYSFTLRAADSANASAFAQRFFRLQVTPVSYSGPGSLTFGNLSSFLSRPLSVNGAMGAVTYAVHPDDMLPPGLSLAGSGVISGTPSSIGRFWFRIVATDSAGYSTILNLNIDIYPVGGYPPMQITTGAMQSYGLGRVEAALSATGGTGTGYVWTLDSGSLPAGLKIRTDVPNWFSSGTTAGIIGVATTVGSSTATIRVTDSVGNSTTLTMNFSVFALMPTRRWDLTDGSVGVPYDYPLGVTGNDGSVTFSVASGSLPPGLNLNGLTGRITGTPTTAGYYNFYLKYSQTSFNLTRSYQIYISPMAITTPSQLPAGTVWTSYSQSVGVTGGTSPYNYTFGCCLPGGISGDSAGLLSGTPGSEANSSFRVTIGDSSIYKVRRNFNLRVNHTPSGLPAISTDNLTGGEDLFIGEARWAAAYSYAGKPTGSWSLATGSTLPPGFEILDPASYQNTNESEMPVGQLVIAGSGTQAGSYPVTLRYTDASVPPVTTSRSYTLRVSALNSDDLPYGYYGVPYSQQIRVLGGVPPYTFAIVDRNFQKGLAMNSTGLVSGIPAETGNYNPLILVTDSAGNTLRRSIYLFIHSGPTDLNFNNAGINKSGNPLANGFVGSSFNVNLTASGGPASYTWSVESGALPPGLTLLSGINLPSGSPAGSAVLTGVPTLAGIYDFSLRVTDSSNSANFGVRLFRIQIGPFQLSISTLLPWTNAGSSFSQTLAVTGASGTVTWALKYNSLLPPGLSLAPDGTLAGSPTTTGRYSFTLVGTDTNGMFRTFTFTLDVYAAGTYPPLSITTAPDLGRILMGTQSIQIAAFGGQPPYTFSLAPGSAPLPPGFRLQSGPPLPAHFASTSQAGILGVALGPGVYSPTIRMTDSTGANFDRTFALRIVGVLSSMSNPAEAAMNVAYSYQLTPSGGVAPFTFALTGSSGLLPPGISLSASGLLSGTPTASGAYPFTVRITDSSGDYWDWSHTLSVTALRLTNSLSMPRLMPAGTQNAAYSQTLTVAGGTPPYTWSVVSGSSMPSGLSLSPAGAITGTLSTGNRTSTTVKLTDSAGNSLQLALGFPIVSASLSMPSFSTGNDLGDFSVNNNLESGISATGGIPPYTYAVESGSTLPGGLFLRTASLLGNNYTPLSAFLQGRTTTPGNFTFTLRATDSAGNSTTRAFSMRVARLSTLNTSMPLSGKPAMAIGTPFTETLLGVGGTSPYTWSPYQFLPEGLSLTAGGVLSGTPMNTGYYSFGVNLSDSAGNTAVRYFNVTVASGAAGTLRIEAGPDLGTASFGYSSFSFTSSGSALATPNFSYSVESGSTLPPGLALLSGSSLPDVSSNPTTTAILAGYLSTPGTYKFTLRVTDSSGYLGLRTLTLKVVPLVFITNSLPPATTQSAYYAPIKLAGGTAPYTISLAPGSLPLPPGLSLNSSNQMVGTPTVPGVYSFTLMAGDAAGNSMPRSFTVNVSSLLITNNSILPLAVYGQSYVFNLAATRSGSSPVLWSASNLCCGLSLDPNTGVLSGTINSTVSNRAVTVTARYGPSGSADYFSKVFLLNIRYPYQSQLVNITTSRSMSDISVNSFINYTLSASGGLPPYTWSLVSGSLPPGLALGPAEEVNGTPTPKTTFLMGVATTPGLYTFTLRATDTAGTFSQRTFTVAVTPVSLAGSSLRRAIFGQSYGQQVVAVGGTPPYTYTLLPYSAVYPIPPGLTMSGTGLLTGTPSNSGLFSMRIQVGDSAGASTQRAALLYIDTAGHAFLDWAGSGGYGPLSDASLGVNAAYYLYPNAGTSPITAVVEAGSTLPPGLSLLTGSDMPSGFPGTYSMISGVPTTPGNYAFTTRLTDATGSFVATTANLRVTPLHVPRPPLPAFPALATGKVGTPFSYTYSAVNGTPPYTFTLAAENYLPDGLSLSSGGTLSGTPTTVGSFSFQYVIKDASNLTLIEPASVYIYPAGSTLPIYTSASTSFFDASAGSLYDRELNTLVYWGIPPFTWSLAAGSTLPTGLSIAAGSGGASDSLRGTPTAAGTSTFGLEVRDSLGQTSSTLVSLVVSPLSLSPAALPAAVSGSSYSQALSASGGTGPYTYKLSYSSDLPNGLSLSSAGILSGVPTTLGMFYIRVEVRDSAGAVLNRVYNLAVNAAGSSGPDLALTKTHTGTFTAGASGTYLLTITNVGNGPTTGPITVTDVLPSGLSFVSGSGTGWSCSAAGQTVTCGNSGPLASGVSSAITLVAGFSGAISGSVTNSAAVATAGDNNAANNSGSDTTSISTAPDLGITKTHTGNFSVGTNGVFTLTVSNAGTVNAAGTITVTDSLPAGLTYVSASGTGWTCQAGGQEVICTNSNPLSAGASSTLLLTVSVGAAAIGNLTNTATVVIAGDSNPNNNKASDTVCVAPRINVQPQSQVILSGQSARLTVVASGANSYQWYLGASGDSSNPISGAVSSAFFTPALTTLTRYWVKVSNSCGSVSSETAVISMCSNAVASRTVPLYVPQQPVQVTIVVSPPAGTTSYGIEETPPSGWPVSGIDSGGNYDSVNKMVKWGPFLDAQTRTLRYTVLPPSGSSGEYAVSGTVSVNGSGSIICGDPKFKPGSAHPADINLDWRISISEITAYGGAWKRGDSWPLPPNPIDINYVTNAGTLWRAGEVYHFDGSKSAPLSWVSGPVPSAAAASRPAAEAARPVPGEGVAPEVRVSSQPGAGNGLLVLLVEPPQEALACAVEETIPPGWEISNVSDGGFYDEIRGKVRWGPFFDSRPQSLSYTAVPRQGNPDASTQGFSGTVSCNGRSISFQRSSALRLPEKE